MGRAGAPWLRQTTPRRKAVSEEVFGSETEGGPGACGRRSPVCLSPLCDVGHRPFSPDPDTGRPCLVSVVGYVRDSGVRFDPDPFRRTGPPESLTPCYTLDPTFGSTKGGRVCGQTRGPRSPLPASVPTRCTSPVYVCEVVVVVPVLQVGGRGGLRGPLPPTRVPRTRDGSTSSTPRWSGSVGPFRLEEEPPRPVRWTRWTRRCSRGGCLRPANVREGLDRGPPGPYSLSGLEWEPREGLPDRDSARSAVSWVQEGYDTRVST